MSNEVQIIASGPVGSGKSALLGEIEIMCRSLGVPVRYANETEGRAEKNLTGADWQSELERCKPSVVLVEDQPWLRAPVSNQVVAESDDQGFDHQAEQITRAAGLGDGEINPNATSITDLFIDPESDEPPLPLAEETTADLENAYTADQMHQYARDYHANKNGKVDDYARSLAMHLWREHYREEAPQFELLEDTYGVLSQIDNMLAGLSCAHMLRKMAGDVSDDEILQMFANAVGNENDGTRAVEVLPDEAIGFARALLDRAAADAKLAQARAAGGQPVAWRVTTSAPEGKKPLVFLLKSEDDARWHHEQFVGSTITPLFDHAAAGARDGWQLVPKEPTPMMVGAGARAHLNAERDTQVNTLAITKIAYAAMLAAAPSADDPAKDQKGGA